MLNIEQQRIHTDTVGWSGNTRFAFDLIENSDRVIQVNARAHVRRKRARDLILLVGDYRINSQMDADFRIARRFSIAISLQSSADTRPPAGAVHSTFAIRNVLSYDFGN